jgi:hypothetical protein
MVRRLGRAPADAWRSAGEIKRADLTFGHFVWVAFVVKKNRFLYREPVRLFSPGTIVFGANGGVNLIDELGLTQATDLRASN